MIPTRFIVVMIAILLLALAVGMSRRADARWSEAYANSPDDVKAWFKQQHNARGEWCCDESDGHPFFGDYAILPDGSVIAELDGHPHLIDPDMVLKGANPTGHAVWWYRELASGHRDYCFSPGTLG